MKPLLKIGTRESELAVWQATQVQSLLQDNGIASGLVYIKSEGDINTVTPLYELGVQGIFTRTLDAALLDKRIDIAVHSMKDVPVQLAKGIRQAAVLKRGSYKDIFVPHPGLADVTSILSAGSGTDALVATSSIRRICQWRNRFPHHAITDMRGNVNTRLRKLEESNWQGAIFAAAGLERIGLRPENAIDLDWMLPAPAQGAIMVVCREGDESAFDSCQPFDHYETALCTQIERDFLWELMGGCSTPISGLAQIKNKEVHFKGNMVDPETYQVTACELSAPLEAATGLGIRAAQEIMTSGGENVLAHIRNKAAKKNGI